MIRIKIMFGVQMKKRSADIVATKFYFYILRKNLVRLETLNCGKFGIIPPGVTQQEGSYC